MLDRLLVIEVAGLGHSFFVRHNGGDERHGLRFRPAQSVFPALTCPVQASFRTAAAPSTHGMVFNGVYSRTLRQPRFWEQSSALVEGPRIWEAMRRKGKTVGMIFWQQSLGERVDVLLSPAPIHKHHGGIIDDVYSRPTSLYQELVKRVGHRFKLTSYWGPLASLASSRWIAEATAELMAMADVAPDLLLTYLPHLDYVLLKHGPGSDRTAAAFAEWAALFGMLLEKAEAVGYDVLVFGDYAFGHVDRPLYPNRLLLEQGLLQARNVHGRLYPDFHYSRAFAVVDHEVAFVYANEPSAVEETAEAFRGMEGVDEVLTGEHLAAAGADHRNTAEIVLIAEPGAWFAYPWWQGKAQQPDYATHVDIHNKPGFDPCELFFGWPPPFAVATDATKVKGSHGRVGETRNVAWAATWDIEPEPASLIDLAVAVRSRTALDIR